MATTPTPLSTNQWVKVLKAALYSFGSGFVGGLILGLTGFLSSGSFTTHAFVALVIAALIGGLNTLAVFIKQLYTETL